ncbi:hypothetical protein [Streptomyces fungicidicus]|uniref:hypothetical protein n=1 Tax=Streptomyces fungicidicus TaxID=68203 RepID=UPI0036C3D248
MTKAERALAIERVGYTVWRGGMLMDAAIWFVSGLYKVKWSEAERMVHDAMAKAMTDELDKVIAKIGETHEHEADEHHHG